MAICLDSTFCIDLLKGDPAAVQKARELDESAEELFITAPVLTEFMIGPFAKGGRRLGQGLELLSRCEVIPVDEPLALEAAKLGGECVRRGGTVGGLDLLTAAAAMRRAASVLTRDPDFSRIPGVPVQKY